MEMAEEATENLLTDCEFIRLTWADLCGIHRSILVHNSRVPDLLDKRIKVSLTGLVVGPCGSVGNVQELWDAGGANSRLIPQMETTHLLPWLTNNDTSRKTAEVICEFENCVTGKSVEECPRTLARRQLTLLKDQLNCELLAGNEVEFSFSNSTTIASPANADRQLFSTHLFNQQRNFTSDIFQALMGQRIKVDNINKEMGASQFEIPLTASWGIKPADDTFLCKQTVREIGQNHEKAVTFMSKPWRMGVSNGLHFNHSLWDSDRGRNLFYSPSSPNHLSQTARHWLGGLMHHASALTALCCPTVNCYRRLDHIACPTNIDWGMDYRFATFRCKSYDEKETYIENRLPSGSANPYIVLAATIAAGLDGVRRELEPPAERSNELGALPQSLSNAIKCLREDSVLGACLGTRFIDWWISVKESTDLVLLGHVDLKVESDDDYAKERDCYYHYM